MSNTTVFPPNYIAISLEMLIDLNEKHQLYKDLVIENKKLEYRLKKKERKKGKKDGGYVPAKPTGKGNPILKICKKPNTVVVLPPSKPVVKREKITCTNCNKKVSKSHLKRHQATKKCKAQSITEVVELDAVVVAELNGEVALNSPSDEEVNAYE